MTRALVAAVATLWVGSALLLSEIRWFRRPRLVDRLRPYAPAGLGGGRPTAALGGLRDVIGPLALAVGARASRAFGVHEELATRLRRADAGLSVQAFRLRQLGWATVAFGVAATASLALGLSPALGLFAVTGLPLLVFLALEQRIQVAARRRQHRILLELPVVSEQLGMLLAAGYSLGGALNRLARRGHGACARDLRTVCGRIRHGLSDVDAMREWAALARVDALDRLVHVLALNREAGDLARLISDEARSVRADVHRHLVATIDRRREQVWIPVTVATLLPGVIFLAVPFIEALRLFTAT